MKQQYESEVLYKLMEREGIFNPSSVPPYESEIKQYFIDQIKLAYPKLTDYEAEWLLYNYIEYLPADFPIESVLNVTQCKVDNVVPYAYQSAILKGQTLVNINSGMNQINEKTNIAPFDVLEERIIKCVANGKKYLISGEVSKCTLRLFFDGVEQPAETRLTENRKYVIFSFIGNELNIRAQKDAEQGNCYYNNIKIIEYQEGMENWDIPYFEGMQSVKMPVLTTTGKNLLNYSENFEVNSSWYGQSLKTSSVIIVDNKSNLHIKNDTNGVTKGATYSINVPKNTVLNFGYEIIENSENSKIHIFIHDDNKSFLYGEQNNTKNFITYNSNSNETLNVSYMIENIGEVVILPFISTATTYEPYKSNILTVNDDVTLRGIGEVQDTLDCLTGEVTERIGEIVLDGSQSVYNDNNGAYIKVDAVKRVMDYTNVITCDKLPTFPGHGYLPGVENGISAYASTNNHLGQNWLYVKINNSIDKDEIKQWLSQNPITVQYQLATEVVKTVDLTITNQDGEECYFMPIEGTMHMATNGQPIKPLLDVEVPVEAITQNLASFINMKMNDEGE